MDVYVQSNRALTESENWRRQIELLGCKQLEYLIKNTFQLWRDSSRGRALGDGETNQRGRQEEEGNVLLKPSVPHPHQV